MFDPAFHRQPYSKREDLEIVKYLAKRNLFNNVRGNVIWEQMEEAKVCPGRTFQSLRNRFLRNISKEFGSYMHVVTQYKAKLPKFLQTQKPKEVSSLRQSFISLAERVEKPSTSTRVESSQESLAERFETPSTSTRAEPSPKRLLRAPTPEPVDKNIEWKASAEERSIPEKDVRPKYRRRLYSENNPATFAAEDGDLPEEVPEYTCPTSPHSDETDELSPSLLAATPPRTRAVCVAKKTPNAEDTEQAPQSSKKGSKKKKVVDPHSDSNCEQPTMKPQDPGAKGAGRHKKMSQELDSQTSQKGSSSQKKITRVAVNSGSNEDYRQDLTSNRVARPKKLSQELEDETWTSHKSSSSKRKNTRVDIDSDSDDDYRPLQELTSKRAARSKKRSLELDEGASQTSQKSSSSKRKKTQVESDSDSHDDYRPSQNLTSKRIASPKKLTQELDEGTSQTSHKSFSSRRKNTSVVIDSDSDDDYRPSKNLTSKRVAGPKKISQELQEGTSQNSQKSSSSKGKKTQLESDSDSEAREPTPKRDARPKKRSQELDEASQTSHKSSSFKRKKRTVDSDSDSEQDLTSKRATRSKKPSQELDEGASQTSQKSSSFKRKKKTVDSDSDSDQDLTSKRATRSKNLSRELDAGASLTSHNSSSSKRKKPSVESDSDSYDRTSQDLTPRRATRYKGSPSKRLKTSIDTDSDSDSSKRSARHQRMHQELAESELSEEDSSELIIEAVEMEISPPASPKKLSHDSGQSLVNVVRPTVRSTTSSLASSDHFSPRVMLERLPAEICCAPSSSKKLSMCFSEELDIKVEEADMIEAPTLDVETEDEEEEEQVETAVTTKEKKRSRGIRARTLLKVKDRRIKSLRKRNRCLRKRYREQGHILKTIMDTIMESSGSVTETPAPAPVRGDLLRNSELLKNMLKGFDEEKKSLLLSRIQKMK